MFHPVTNTHRFRFGPFEVDVDTAELRKSGRVVRLQQKPLEVLIALLEERGKLVSRDLLRRRLWPSDTFVDFDNGLNTAVSKLRDALGDTAEEPRYIETLARRGYRFLALAEELSTPVLSSSRELRIHTYQVEPAIVVVEISGKMVFGPECQHIEWLIAELLRENEKKIIFDLSGVNRIDSMGIGIIVVCFARVRDSGGTLRVAGAKGSVEKLLKMTAVDTAVPLHTSTSQAVEEFSRAAS